MILEGLIETAVPFIGRVFGYIFVELLAHIIFYFTGYAILKAVTLGKHPKKFISQKSDSKQDYRVIFLGFLFWCLVLAILLFKRIG